MARQGTEPIKVNAFMVRLETAQIDAAEVYGTDFDSTDFISLFDDSREYVEGKGWVTTLPIIPAHVYHEFDKLVMTFGVPTLDSVTALTLTLYAVDKAGDVRRIGESVMNGSSLLPSITFARTQEPLYLAVSKITTSGNGLTKDADDKGLRVWLQGAYNSEMQNAVVSY